MDNCDILVFRKKTLIQSLYSMFALDLDNHVGIVLKINNKFYLYHFVITSSKKLISNILFRTNFKCGEAKLTPIEYIMEDEFYHYKAENKIELDDKQIKDIISNAKNLNYQSNLLILINFFLRRNIICKKINNEHTCISLVLYVLEKIDCYDKDFYNDDYYKKKIYNFEGAKIKYKLVGSNNSCKKDLSKFNPYGLSYLIALIQNLIVAFSVNLYNLKQERIPNYKIILAVIIYTITTVWAGSYSTRLIKDKKGYNGMRFIGAYLGVIGLSVVFERLLNISSNNLLNFIFYLTTPRVFFTRFASWLCNDLTGKINKETLRPYDTTFYESIFEGLLPYMVIILFYKYIDSSILNITVCLIYTTSRYNIEYYKHSYLGNKKDKLKTDILTCGQIDSIIYFIFTLWYIFKDDYLYGNIFEYIILFILFMDVSYRITRNKIEKDTIIKKNCPIISLKWKKTYNTGFYGGHMKDESKEKKLIYGIVSLLISNLLSLNNLPYIFTFNIAALLNIGERYVYGFVTDYLTINFMGFKTYNLNFADIIITGNVIYSIFSRIYILRS